MRPQPEQTISKCNQLHDHSNSLQNYIRLNRKIIILKAVIPKPLLPPSHLLTIMRRNTKRFDCIKVIKCLDLKSHQLTARLEHLLAKIPLLLQHRP